MSLKAVIFDFDGVIVESMDIKASAFAHLFRAEPKELVDAIVRFHHENGGMSRFDKFRIIYRDFLKRELSAEVEQRLGTEFSEFCYAEMLSCPYVNGVIDFLEKHHADYLFFIVSGTPHDEINDIVDDRGIRSYFKGVWGTPGTKAELIKMILQRYKLKASEAVLIGDSPTDYHGARDAGIAFIARIAPSGFDPFKAANITVKKVIPDMTDLHRIIS